MNAVECLRAQASPSSGPDDYTLTPISAVRIEPAAYWFREARFPHVRSAPGEIGVRSLVSRRYASRATPTALTAQALQRLTHVRAAGCRRALATGCLAP